MLCFRVQQTSARDGAEPMQPTRATLEEYRTFICNPQGDGVWSLRIEFTGKQISKLGSLLNIESYMLRPARSDHHLAWMAPYYEYDSRPGVLLARLFAYLRGAMPARERDALPGLTPRESLRLTEARAFKLRRAYRFYEGFLNPPTRLSAAKRRQLSGAVRVYRDHFSNCRVSPVPEDMAKIDIACPSPLTYLQAAEELPALRVSSPCEATLRAMQAILGEVLGEPPDAEMTKIFSPENTLMGMYMPVLEILPLGSILKERTATGNVRQALGEAREDRFVHAIRAVGIAAEELLVEVYETFLREKAPEAPLGNIIRELSERIQDVVRGVRAVRQDPISAARKQIGKAIESEKKGAANPGFLVLAEAIQKSVLPAVEDLKQAVDGNFNLSSRAQGTNIFPASVRRCLSELVILRNRVSHRVERVVSVASVGYIDAAIALRDFIIVARWWEAERKRINYKASRKTMIQDTVRRSALQDLEPEESV